MNSYSIRWSPERSFGFRGDGHRRFDYGENAMYWSSCRMSSPRSSFLYGGFNFQLHTCKQSSGIEHSMLALQANIADVVYYPPPTLVTKFLSWLVGDWACRLDPSSIDSQKSITPELRPWRIFMNYREARISSYQTVALIKKLFS